MAEAAHRPDVTGMRSTDWKGDLGSEGGRSRQITGGWENAGKPVVWTAAEKQGWFEAEPMLQP